MRPPRRHIAQELARVNQRGRAFQAAAKKLEHVAVCLIGYEGRVPRHFGDNHGAWPIRVATTTKPRDIAKRADLESPIHKVRVHDLVWLETEAHAKRLKAALDKLLLGTTQEDLALRHGWRDASSEPEIVWPILLEEALRGLRKREKIEVFDTDERNRRVSSATKRR